MTYESHHKPQKAGQETVSDTFILPTMHVSAKVQSISRIIYTNFVVEIVYSLLNDMILPATMRNAELWTTAKSCLDLFRLQDQVTLSHDSAVKSMIMYNDCVYVSHHLSTLGTQFQEYLPEKIHNYCFLDLIPLFNQVGQDALLKELDYQATVITSYFSLPDFDACVSNCLNHVKTLSKHWCLTASTRSYLDCLGIIVDFTLSAMADRVISTLLWKNEFYLQFAWTSVQNVESFFKFEKTRVNLKHELILVSDCVILKEMAFIPRSNPIFGEDGSTKL